MSYFNPHNTPEECTQSRRIHRDNLRMLPADLRARIAAMPTRTPAELGAARAASEAARYQLKAKLK